MPTPTICFANQKGGVAKTLSVTNLAGILHRRGAKVLLVDADVNGGLTGDCGLAPVAIDPERTLTELICAEEPPDPAQLVVKSPYGADLLPCNSSRVTADYWLAENPDVSYTRLRDRLKPIAADYDVCMIDTGPAFNDVLMSCLVASDHLIVLARPTPKDLLNVDELMSQATAVDDKVFRGRRGPLDRFGFVFVDVEAKTLHTQESLEAAKEMIEDYGFYAVTFVAHTTAIREASTAFVPVSHFHPRRAKVAQDAAAAYEQFAVALAKRIGLKLKRVPPPGPGEEIPGMGPDVVTAQAEA